MRNASPLFGVEGTVHFEFLNVSIENDRYSQLFLIETIAEVRLANSRFRDSMGMIVAAGDSSHVEISDCNFTRNFSPNYPLFQYDRSSFEIRDAQIEENGGQMILSAGEGSFGSIVRVVFGQNKPSGMVIRISGRASLNVSSSNFRDNLAVMEVEVNSAQMRIGESVFVGAALPAIVSVDGKLVIEKCFFNHSVITQTVVRSAGGEVIMVHCNFSCESYRPVLELSGMVSLVGLAFQMVEAEALPVGLIRKCVGCSFGRIVRPKRVPTSIWKSPLLWINGVLLGIVCWRTRRIRNMGTRKDN
jgi:hypothetical protein